MGDTLQIRDELYALREGLRSRHTVNGKEPRICSDESLDDMAERLPRNRADLLMIKGIGETFADRYGNDFLAITSRYANARANSVPLKGRSLDILKEMEKKLINISKGNPLLFNHRTVRSRTFDLLRTDVRDPDTIINGQGAHMLCGSDDKAVYERLNLIVREVLRDFREKGSTDLYIAYPFVSGSLSEDFPIRAPLALFPVRMQRSRSGITVEYDDSRDALFNNALILANMKFNSVKGHLPDPVMETVSTDIRAIITYYSKNGLEMDGPIPPLSEFQEHRQGDMSPYGKLVIENCALIGKFPLYSNSIQKDFSTLISREGINGTLDALISEGRGEDITSSDIIVNEKDIAYINPINSAQEKVIQAIHIKDGLVVQGPPGTGKSQVITGLIATAVSEGRNVLMVSEKKTALDVVYSRLGDLSRYVMMVDDVGNKDLFYDQLRNMLSIQDDTEDPVSTDTVSERIEERISELTRIADGMYRPDSFGVEPYLMYSLVKKVDLNDPAEMSRYLLLKDNISPSLMNVSYRELSDSYERFKDPAIINDLRTYYQCLDAVPWMAHMRRDLSPNELRSFRTEIRELNREYRETSSKGFLSRLFGRGQMTRRATEVINRYFDGYNARYIDHLVNDPEDVLESLEMYDDYTSKLSSYERLPRDQRMYGENIISVNTSMPSSYEMSNDELFAFIMMDHLRRFEENNKDLLKDIDEFDTIRDDVDISMSKKRDMTRERIGSILRGNLRYIRDSKMSSEIDRIANSRRRWSVNRFLATFGSDIFRGIKVWLMTPEAVSELLPLEMGMFDLLVFDEASQMYVEKGFPSIYRSNKVVVAGDHKQLRPSSLGSGRMSFDEDVLDEDSLLDLARTKYDSLLLNFHYRSRYEDLIAFSNYAFYGGRLYVSPDVDVPEKPPIETHLMKDGRWEDKCNRKEAEYIVGMLRDILTSRKEDETIGIITFNITQRDLVYDLIEEECDKDPTFAEMIQKEMSRRDNGEDVGLFLKNIESVQGDERDIIIFSVGYAKNDDGRIPKMFGWLNNKGGENRLNVAISRARKKIHIVTSFLPEELDVSDSKNDGPLLLKSYLEYAFAVSSNDVESERRILSSYAPIGKAVPKNGGGFNLQICERLRDRGYDAIPDFGIGGYSVDVAVRKGDRYVMGIECDNSLYAGAVSTRERDYHRQKYFEYRGWYIRRVWSNKWWNDPESETDAIVEELEQVCEG